MFKKVSSHQIQTGSAYLIDNDHVYFAENDKLFDKNLITGEINGSLNVGRKIYKVLDNKETIIAIFESTGQMISKDKFTIIQDKSFESLSLKQSSPFKNKIFVLIGEDLLDNYFGLYDIDEKKILWTSKDVLDPIILSGYLFSYANSEIRHHDFDTADVIWSRSVSEIGRHYVKIDKRWEDGEIDKVLGIYKNILWLLLKNGLIIGLNIETGKIAVEIKEPVEYPESYQIIESNELNFYYAEPCMFDANNAKIIGLVQSNRIGSPAFYYEVDLATPIPQLKITQLPNDNLELFYMEGGAIGYAWPFDDEYIYVCNYRNYKLALFNRKTKQIDWVHQMDIETAKKSFIIKMEVQGNRWYVLDNSKTLYVYEREA